MREELQRLIELLLPQQEHFDALAVGVVDFRTGSFEVAGHAHLFFDLASVTKVLGGSAVHALHPQAITPELRLLLEHRAGLPAWGLLPRQGWREILTSYPISDAPTLYSDYSCMRANLEIERALGKSVPELLRGTWDRELCFWKDLPPAAECPVTGERGFHPIQGTVHDPNAWVIGEWTGHAGLFGTAAGVCRTLLALEDKTQFIARIKTELSSHRERFVYGWDRVEDPQSTLAGRGCSGFTFGHLGFTGTSVWIDADKRKGHVILSNATRDGWYLKAGLNDVRRAVGEVVWRS